MAEYIEREAVLKKMHALHTVPFFKGHRTDEDVMFDTMVSVVEEHPTADVVEVVRCKNCKWWENETYCRNVNGLNHLVFNGDWFCASGERRAEE